MFNQELFNKICTGTCTFEELENFVTKIDKKEFDLDNAFDKYYSLERILFVINKYNKKQISAKFLLIGQTLIIGLLCLALRFPLTTKVTLAP